MKRLSLALGFVLSSLLAEKVIAQTITYQNASTPTQLVENILLGQGVIASNIMFNGTAVNATSVQPNALSYTATGFPFDGGVYLRTQSGGNVSFDPDLNAISTNTITNGAILEFDFVATGDTLSFNYMFASAEYPVYVCSGFNDVFGFFISGPGISGPYSNGAENIALVPGTTVPVAINTVNSGVAGAAGSPATCAAQDPNWTSNSIYYTTAYSGYSGQSYNGGTVSLSANSDLICGETYHIKLAVSNVGDQSLNSGVYLEAGSFTTLPVAFQFNTFTLDNYIYEGCNQLGTLMFTREGCGDLNDPLVAYLTYGGQGTNGVDYTLLPDSVYFAPGEDTIFWQIIPFEDFINEGVESVIMTIMSILTTGDTVYSTGTFFISDNPELFAIAHDTTLICLTDSTEIMAEASGGFGPYSYSWNTGDTTNLSTAYFNGNGTQDFYVTVTDACGYTDTDTLTVVMNQTLSIDSILMLSPASCLPEGSIFATTFPFGATPGTAGMPSTIDLDFDWTYEGDTNIVFPDQGSLNNLYGGWYYLELTDNIANCTVYDSVYVETINTPQAAAAVNPNYGCSPVVSTFSNTSNNATSYTWDFGNGNIITVNDQNDIAQTYYADAGIMMIASNGIPECNDTTFLYVDIVECGCMDPQATNYNPNAVFDDGSCTYPVPTVIAPNVITANGDNVNGFFFLKTENAEKIEITILNRWGNVIFEGTGNELVPPMWDGTDRSGKDVEDGVYFYRYKVTGIMGDELEGHGFVEVVR